MAEGQGINKTRLYDYLERCVFQGLRPQKPNSGRCVSIMSNIAEGFERDGTGEFNQFLAIAKGSAGEVRSQLYVALDQEYMTRDVFDELYAKALQVSRMIGGLMGYLRGSGFKGTKFKKRHSRT
jgi:four helix bundle protein